MIEQLALFISLVTLLIVGINTYINNHQHCSDCGQQLELEHHCTLCLEKHIHDSLAKSPPVKKRHKFLICQTCGSIPHDKTIICSDCAKKL